MGDRRHFRVFFWQKFIPLFPLPVLAGFLAISPLTEGWSGTAWTLAAALLVLAVATYLASAWIKSDVVLADDGLTLYGTGGRQTWPVEKLLKVSGDDLSLSSAVGEDGTLELGDTLEQDTVPSVELQLMKSSFEEQIHNLVAELDEKEREVLRMRFGLDGEEPKTLQEIGEALGLSRERIRQIESKAKEKLRRSRLAQGLRGALN